MTTTINVNDLSGSELINKYNELATAAGKPTVNRFASLTKGRKRLARMLAELQGGQVASEEPVLSEERVAELVEHSDTEAQQLVSTVDVAAAAGETDAYLQALAETFEQAPDAAPVTEEQPAAEAQGGAVEDDSGIPEFLRRDSEAPRQVAVVDLYDNSVVAVVPAAEATPAAELDAAVPPTLAEEVVEAIRGDAAAFIAAAAEAPVNQPVAPKTKKARVAPTGPKKGTGGTGPGGETLKQQQDRYNTLAAEARGLGLRAKHHTSTFERHTDGERIIAKLQAAVDEAKAKPEYERAAEQAGA